MSQPDNIVLFSTEVGSRMWGMESLSSDYDIFEVFQVPTKHILEGRKLKESMPSERYFDNEGRDIDKQFMEIGHLVNLLIKGNCNALWGVCSPVVHQDSGLLQTLRDIAKCSLSKATFHSVKGMAASQFEDATRRDSVKNFASCYRTLQFGTRLLTTGKIRFDPVPEEILAELAGKSPCDPIYHKFEELNEDYNLSELPDAVDEELFREFLYHLRSDQLLYGE